MGLANKMRWHGPSIDVARFHAAADIFALPTTYEPFGLVIIEAMASGLPVIASALAGASAAIEHGKSGFSLDDPTDVVEIGAALTALLDPTTRVAMGAAAAAAAQPYEVDTVMAEADRLIFHKS
jgi:UDP-glucose:(heptosyl)LPS alpha-1,3-glucosyltransferase